MENKYKGMDNYKKKYCSMWTKVKFLGLKSVLKILCFSFLLCFELFIVLTRSI